MLLNVGNVLKKKYKIQFETIAFADGGGWSGGKSNEFNRFVHDLTSLPEVALESRELLSL